MEWVIRNLYWIIVACIAACVFGALYLGRRHPLRTGDRPHDHAG
jgi:hypothetical protein